MNVTVSTNETYQGSIVEINVTVQNEGDQTEARLVVMAYYDSTLIGTKAATNLAPNNQVSLTLNWNTKSAKPGNYTISVQASPVPGETDTANNGFTDGVVKIKPIPSDVNADGKVNWLDVCIITKALGSIPGSPRWNPYCDLNGDNKINLKDLCIALQHFGQRSVWTDITKGIDEEHHIIFGETDHFSIFGGRSS